jgi:hypothetical protein
MIEAAAARRPVPAGSLLTSARPDMTPRAYTVASGIFNVKQDVSDAVWWDYVTRTLDDIASISVKGFSCNCLTTSSDPERRRAELFYADPSEMLRHCLARFSRRVVLIQDYPLYEFTMLVRL